MFETQVFLQDILIVVCIVLFVVVTLSAVNYLLNMETPERVEIENLPTVHEVVQYPNGTTNETTYKGTYPRG